MPLKDQLTRDKPWAVLGWTRRYWKKAKMWKKAGVTEEKMTRLVLSLDNETVQNLKDHAEAEALLEHVFANEDIA
jgi:hypothetical protein